MTSTYSANLYVQPFILAPIPGTGKEYDYLISSKESYIKKTTLAENIYTQIQSDNLVNPFIVQAFAIDNFIVVTTVIQTKELDEQSGRSGLKFVYGAIIDGKFLLANRNVCIHIFQYLRAFIQDEFQVSLDLDGFGKIIQELRKRNNNSNNLINDDVAFISKFETHFSLTNNRISNRHVVIFPFWKVFKLTKYNKYHSFIQQKDSWGFWSQIDQHFGTPRPSKKKIRKKKKHSQTNKSTQQQNSFVSLTTKEMLYFMKERTARVWRIIFFISLIPLFQMGLEIGIRIYINDIVEQQNVLSLIYFTGIMIAILGVLQAFEAVSFLNYLKHPDLPKTILRRTLFILRISVSLIIIVASALVTINLIRLLTIGYEFFANFL